VEFCTLHLFLVLCHIDIGVISAKIIIIFRQTPKTATEYLGKCIRKMVLWISRGKCRVDLWGEIIIIIRKTASTFHNGLAANNESSVFNFANNGDITPRYPYNPASHDGGRGLHIF
jgi:hypothetical protein